MTEHAPHGDSRTALERVKAEYDEARAGYREGLADLHRYMNRRRKKCHKHGRPRGR